MQTQASALPSLYPSQTAQRIGDAFSQPFCILPLPSESATFGTLRFLRRERFRVSEVQADFGGGMRPAILIHAGPVPPSTMRYTAERLARLYHAPEFLSEKGLHNLQLHTVSPRVSTLSKPVLSWGNVAVEMFDTTIYFV